MKVMLFKSSRAVEGDDVTAAPEPVSEAAEVSPVQTARDRLRKAVDREQTIRDGQEDLQLGIDGAADRLAAARREKDVLLHRLYHSEAFNADELAATKRAIVEAEAAMRDSEAMLAQRDELLKIAVNEIEQARENLDAVLRKEVAGGDSLLQRRMAEYARVRDDAAARYKELEETSRDTGHLLRGTFGPRATVPELEEMLERHRTVLA
jgi:chromosome segregation ATPase